MLKNFKRVIFTLLFTVCVTNLAAAKIQVMVLPFEVYSQTDLAYLEKEIPEVIKKHLTQEGALVVDPVPDPERNLKEMMSTHQSIRRLGVRSGADFIVWGSLTRIADQYSIDAKVFESFGDAPLSAYTVEGQGLESLAGSIRGLTNDMGIKIFKRERIVDIRIEGIDRIEADAIENVLSIKRNDIYRTKNVSEDLKAIFRMGYFEDVRIEAETAAEGKILVVKVKEKPTVRVVSITGNYHYDVDDLEDELTVKTGAILNLYQIQNDVGRIENFYKEKNYHNVQVAYEIDPVGRNQADLVYTIKEGDKLRIEKIAFEGNRSFSDRKLLGEISTSVHGFFSWFTSSGDLDRDKLSQDVASLYEFYSNNGYIKVKVAEPEITFKENRIEILFKIEEGQQFKINQLDLVGDLVYDKEVLMKKIQIASGSVFKRSALRRDLLTLSDLYGDLGYAYAEVVPLIKDDPQTLMVDIVFKIQKGPLVRFEEIVIAGNTKTRDKVIRRELKVYEQGLYNRTYLKKAVRNLHRLEFFEEVKVNTSKGSEPDLMALKIDVTEKPTGSFSFGGGYSSVENFFVTASVTQRNLFGRGQRLTLQADLGGASNRYSIRFTEPWLFDIPLSAGINLYRLEVDYESYDKDSFGAGLRFGYPIFEDTRLIIGYEFENAELANVADDTPQSVRNLVGDAYISSSVTATIKYDTRDRIINPSKGIDASISGEYAGLGGDIGFTKAVGELGGYLPLVWDLVGHVRTKAGYISEAAGKALPAYERFFLGGINGLRGFDRYDLSPKQANDLGVQADIGGTKFVQLNLELIIPISKETGLNGVLFFDMGDLYDTNEDIQIGDLRKSVGFGFRWYSPIGPIRIENGYVLDKQAGEASNRWEFAMGHNF